MQCPECQFDNPEGIKFCGKCGSALQLTCIHCNSLNPPGFKFCGECGCELSVTPQIKFLIQEKVEEDIITEDYADDGTFSATDSERKCVTVMFSDLTGYTEMSEKLDPEKVKEITSSIFSELTKIIDKYEGFIEKYIGDAILAVFGAKKAFEDSALRAIKAAREIHTYVKSVSPKYEKLIGRQLSMHTGIKTGLVVTGEMNYQKGTHGLVGDTINTAARLMSISQAGEILVDHDSFIQTQGYFDFDNPKQVKVKGKADYIQAYRVSRVRKEPKKLHRLHGLRAKLIGRSFEMRVLQDAVKKLLQDQSSLIAVCGTAGTGKSRLIHELKNTLDLSKIQWFDANAYPYTKNTPYYPLIDLLTRAFRIEEGDKTDAIKNKVESGLESLLGEGSDKIPYIGGLFSIDYPKASDVSPEYWKEQLIVAVRELIKALTASGPMIICMEDIHWADASYMELVHKIVSDPNGPLLIICLYRPTISFLTNLDKQTLKTDLLEIRLKDLSPSETQTMVSSLLKAENVPEDLREFIHDNVEGNPFYIEELINSLIDSGVLSNQSGHWELIGKIDDSIVSTNIQGVIASRIDRLGRDTKRILQEASVIGRTFLFDILERISDIKEDIDSNLVVLERLDLIKAKSIMPTLEYIFKHALTQEIVYNGLIKSEKRSIHEKIGNVIETLFKGRLSEFYETLAFHYSRGKSVLKAVEYLIKSGEKSINKFAIDESHEYYKKAFELIISIQDKTLAQSEKLIDILNKWAVVYYYRGDYLGLVDLFTPYQKTAENITDSEQLGMFYTWMGLAFTARPKMPKGIDPNKRNATQIAIDYLEKALKIGKDNKNLRVVCYARIWLSWLLADMGFFEKGINHGIKANQMALDLRSDSDLFFMSLSGVGWNYVQMGHAEIRVTIGRDLITYGHKHSHPRCLAIGYIIEGAGYYLSGDLQKTIQFSEKAVTMSIDPLLRLIALGILTFGLIEQKDMTYVERNLNEIYHLMSGISHISIDCIADIIKGLIDIDNDQISKGINKIQNSLKSFYNEDRVAFAMMVEVVIAKVYMEIVIGGKSVKPVALLKNLHFILKNIFRAYDKSVAQLYRVLSLAKKINATGHIGQTHFQLGKMYKFKNKKDLACIHLGKAIQVFEEVGAYQFLENAKTEYRSVSKFKK